MEWLDEAIVLSARSHGENAAVVTLLTAEHGRHAGLVPSGQGQKNRALLQQGNRVQAVWRARLLDQLGTLTLELNTASASLWLSSEEILTILAAACAVTEAALPERQPMDGVYAGFVALLSLQDADLWGPSYVKWELGLLKALGYGLDLASCAVSGETDDLTHVSPRTGRAVTSAVAKPYKEKLLPIPRFLQGAADWDAEAISQGLALTGHFLARHVFAHTYSRTTAEQRAELPPARMRLAAFYEK